MVMRTGVIGLGAMGAPMARNLHAAGHLQALWNRSRDKAEAIAMETGARVAADPAELARQCDLIITCVSRDADLEAVIRALEPGLAAGAVVADTSTVSAETARAMAAAISARGAHFLDCPVSGGVEGARQGSLAMMVGGEAAVLARVRGPLSSLATTIVHMGPSGAGQATKAVNQTMAAGINQAVTEALAFGEAMGLPLDKVIDVVSSGAAGNWFLSHRGRSMVAGRYAPGFKLALHRKDLDICRRMAAAAGFPLPLVERTLEDYASLMAAGHGDEDISALYRLKRPETPLGH